MVKIGNYLWVRLDLDNNINWERSYSKNINLPQVKAKIIGKYKSNGNPIILMNELNSPQKWSMSLNWEYTSYIFDLKYKNTIETTYCLYLESDSFKLICPCCK